MSQSILDLYAKQYAENGNDIDFDFEFGDYEIIEEGDWEQDHKYQHATHIVKFMGVYLAVNESRSGSYHTDWFYGDTHIAIIERKEEVKVVVTWEHVGPSVEVPGRD